MSKFLLIHSYTTNDTSTIYTKSYTTKSEAESQLLNELVNFIQDFVEELTFNKKTNTFSDKLKYISKRLKEEERDDVEYSFDLVSDIVHSKYGDGYENHIWKIVDINTL
jgi:hypothetical protein